MSQQVLVTGANGFIGQVVCRQLQQAGHSVTALQRSHSEQPWPVKPWPETGLPDVQGYDRVIHLAGCTDGTPAQLQQSNVTLTERLAQACEQQGVQRLVLVSSIGVYGGSATEALAETSATCPQTDYAASKLAAEQVLLSTLKRCQWSIVRPPLVYGVGTKSAPVKGSFALLQKLVNSGLPLPFAGLTAPRAMVHVEHLASALLACVEREEAAGQIFHLADEPALPVADTIRELQHAKGRRWSRLVPMPASWLQRLAALAGKEAALQQLQQPLLVDSSKARTLLQWQPQRTTRTALHACVMPANPAWQRWADILLAGTGLLLLWPVLLLLCAINAWPQGQPLFRQRRLGKEQSPFTMVKFRTMALGTPSVPTHELPDGGITRLGKLLRASKLDELPQLWNVLKGEMSLVGSRPGLPDHTELTRARQQQGVFNYRPGITGLAQLQGVDMSTPERLAQVDAQMHRQLTPLRYVQLIALTALPPLRRWWPL
ncbi:hypothetical protein GCM10011297_06090 [Bacterioplanes sanyensis]|uniref:sugar transferase n=1 Tax=Bacterioplanes sanyensis TaxID=1249553 RepID=UPI00167506D8|nr:sugar transferase [Bacterioplanes sanyensis]GGY35854.1 hypothetical protein GCM10011297_06090 [Bacterioplanes sanyensis]